ncbi:MAG: hypothetical protein MHM6MM_000269 [Cercozoa sp. M6MM]
MRPSLLSSEASATQSVNMRGLVNLVLPFPTFTPYPPPRAHWAMVRSIFQAVIVAGAASLRLICENFLKYGWLLPSFEVSKLEADSDNTGVLTALSLLPLLSLAQLLLEKAVSRDTPKLHRFASMLHGFLVAVCVIGTSAIVWRRPAPLLSGVMCMMTALAHGMKMVSFAHVHCASSHALRPTLPQLADFLCAPTLCYQPSYPRTQRVRWRFVARRLAELVVCYTLMFFIWFQYLRPVVMNSMSHIECALSWPPQKYGIPVPDYGKCVLRTFERLLKVALPNLCFWLLLFFSFFHSYLNLVAELIRFGDRQWYKDWWNSADLGEYWRKWNLPVHNWMYRHLYRPALQSGMSSFAAQLCAFLLSAVGHELVISIPFHAVHAYAFVAMLAQLPLILLTMKLRVLMPGRRGKIWGNAIFWVSFVILGQPLAVLIYTYERLQVDPSSLAD